MTWQQIPFVRLLLPLIVGIFTYQNSCIQPSFPVFLALFLGSILGLIMLSLKNKVDFAWVRSWGFLMFLVMLQVGWWMAYQQDSRNKKEHLSNHSLGNPQSYIASIHRNTKPKSTTIQTSVNLIGYFDQENAYHSMIGIVLLYLKTDSMALQLGDGDTLIFNGSIQKIKAALNPKAFDFRQYYAHKNIYHQAYISSENWTLMGSNRRFSIHKYFSDYQQDLLKLLKDYIKSPNEYAVAAALLLGNKEALESTIKNAYSESGAIHVLAVSGLHVGLLMWLLNRLLGRPKKKIVRQLKYLLLLIVLWFFSFLTGASASVLRASTMFSFILIGQAINRKTSIYNSLAASAFVLLCIQTSLLQQLGFQLSYLALLGIVYLYPKINKWWYIDNKLGRYIWSGIAISLAAQTAVLPLSLYYFHQLPIYFWLSGLVVSALAGIILSVGIAFFILHSIPLIGSLAAALLYYSIWLMNSLIFTIQALPAAAIKGFWIEYWQLWCFYLILGCILLFIKYKNPKWLIAASTLILSLSLFRVYRYHQQINQHYLYFYHCRQNILLSKITGLHCTLISDKKLDKPRQIKFATQNHLWSLGIQKTLHYGIRDSIQQADMIFENGKGIIANKRIFIFGPEQLLQSANTPLEVDYILIHNNPKLIDIKQISSLCHYQKIIFTTANHRYKTKAWIEQCKARNIPYIDLATKGAFGVKL